MPSNIPQPRRRKAFNEGRRSVKEAAENPYDNPTLRRLWEQGRAQQGAGSLLTPVPPLEHGETRARRAPRNPQASGVVRPDPNLVPAMHPFPAGAGNAAATARAKGPATTAAAAHRPAPSGEVE
jgi:hypothetical protein